MEMSDMLDRATKRNSDAKSGNRLIEEVPSRILCLASLTMTLVMTLRSRPSQRRVEELEPANQVLEPL